MNASGNLSINVAHNASTVSLGPRETVIFVPKLFHQHESTGELTVNNKRKIEWRA